MESRLLHDTCDPGFVTCPTKTAFLHASICYKTDKCVVLIVDCGYGYYANSYLTTTCTACTLPNCLDCTKVSYITLVCTTCASGYYKSSAGTCVICPINCSTCVRILTSSTPSCLTCKSTFTPKVTSGITSCVCTSTQYLLPSPLSCVNCSTTSTGCKTCSYSSSQVCASCLTGYFLTAPTCTACMPVCYNCTAAATCDACKNNLVLNAGGVCECAVGLYLEPISMMCTGCTGLQANCQVCGYSGGYNPAAPTAVICSSPAPGYFVLPNGTASPCIQYCQVCADALTCTTPYPTFSYDSLTHTVFCDSTLPTPLFLDASGSSCVACSSAVPGCLSCVNVTTTQCNDCTGNGYYSLGPFPVAACTACPNKCLTCTSGSSCGSC